MSFEKGFMGVWGVPWGFGVSAAGRLMEERSFYVWVCLGGLQPPRGGCPRKEGE